MKKYGLLVALSMYLLPLSVWADDDWRGWPMGERLRLSIGIYEPDIDTDATVTQLEPYVPGTPIDFEDQLGLDDSESALFASLHWRMFKRHRLNFNYFNLDRDASALVTDDIVFDGVLFPGGSVAPIDVDTRFDLSVYEASYSYSIIFDEKKDFFVGLGVSAQDIDIEVSATDFPVLSASEDFVAPLPTINLGFNYAFSESWLLEIMGGYMDVDVKIDGDDFDGKILIGDVGLRWKPLRHLGAGLHYSYFKLDGEYEDDEVHAEVDLKYKGPRLSVDLFF